MKILLTNMAIRYEMGVENDIPDLFNINEFGAVNYRYIAPLDTGSCGTESLLFFLSEINKAKEDPLVLKLLKSMLGRKEFDPTEYLISKEVFCAYADIDETIFGGVPIGESLEYFSYNIYRVSEGLVIVELI